VAKSQVGKPQGANTQAAKQGAVKAEKGFYKSKKGISFEVK
jgi:hypothetical protein